MPCHEYSCRVKIVLWTQSYSQNKILAISVFALPVLTYGFDINQVEDRGPTSA